MSGGTSRRQNPLVMVANTEAPICRIAVRIAVFSAAVAAADSRVQGTSKTTTQWLPLLENAGERVAARSSGRGLVWVVSGLMHDEPVRPCHDPIHLRLTERWGWPRQLAVSGN